MRCVIWLFVMDHSVSLGSRSLVPANARKVDWRRWVVVSLAMILVLDDAAGCHALADNGPAFRDFWKAFRSAALHGDMKALSPMIAIPFIVEDSLDTQKRLDEVSAVLELMPSLLDQDVGLSAEPESMRRYIERLREPSGTIPGSVEGRVRIGQFLFRRIGGRWMFVGAYLEP